jgi:hypothetical protein
MKESDSQVPLISSVNITGEQALEILKLLAATTQKKKNT